MDRHLRVSELPYAPARPVVRAVRRWPSDRARDWVDRFVSTARGSATVDAVVLVGSVARSVAHERSDVDLVVIFQGEQPDIGEAPIDVDVWAYARESVDHRVADGNDLLGWAIHYGVPLFDRRHYWRDLVSRWAGRVPLPSVALAEARAARTEAAAANFLALGDEDAALELAVSALTHRARAALLRRQIYPASRPELPGQLEAIGQETLADLLRCGLTGKATARQILGADAHRLATAPKRTARRPRQPTASGTS